MSCGGGGGSKVSRGRRRGGSERARLSERDGTLFALRRKHEPDHSAGRETLITVKVFVRAGRGTGAGQRLQACVAIQGRGE